LETPQSIEAVGSDVEDAIARALEALNVRRDQVDVLVLETNPRAARVRLTVKHDRPLAAVATGSDTEVAERIVAELLDKMHLTVSVSAREAVVQDAEDAQRGPAIEVDVKGDDLSNLIGRRGETLDNLQYVARLLIAKELGRYVNLIIDVAGYKSHRAEMLKQLAQRLAEQVVNTHRPASMEPMPANERRIIHLALRDHPGVRTESVGLGERRKVTIVPKSVKH
jgi:spoIIIJ-associated protein